LCSKHLGEYLIPVADPEAPVTWPTIVVPPTEELLSIDTDEEREHTFELLRAWRVLVDGAASGRPDPNGWIGGIRVPHPMMPSLMTTRWPWRHRPIGKAGRPGQACFHELFGVSVDAR
jgi:hypothetical protein